MTRLIALTTLGLALPAAAAAHVGVRPREPKAGAEGHYTVRVPTEGAAATTSVRFEIPEGVTVLDAPKPAEGTVDARRSAYAWKIRHSHTSSRPRRPAGGGV